MGIRKIILNMERGELQRYAYEAVEDNKKLQEIMEAQIIEYESRGQVLYAGLGAPSSIRLVYGILGKKKPADLPAFKK